MGTVTYSIRGLTMLVKEMTKLSKDVGDGMDSD